MKRQLNNIAEPVLRFLFGRLVHVVYRIRTVNAAAVPATGGVLFTPNHMTFVDGLILQFSVGKRKLKFVVAREYFSNPVMSWFLHLAGCIPINQSASKDAIKKVAEALSRGEAVCLFPEGSLSRTGFLMPFKKGLELVLRHTPDEVVIVPVFLDRLWGSLMSFKGRKFFWKVPEKLPYPVTILFGNPVDKNISVFELRQKVSELSSEAFSLRKAEYRSLPHHFIKTARKYLFKKIISDITDVSYSYLKLLTASIIVSKRINVISGSQKMIGLMLPASAAGVICNIATGLSGKTAVNLNFRAGDDALGKAMAKCEISTILTSRLFIRKAGINEMNEFVYLEDVIKDVGTLQKTLISLAVLLLPAFIIRSLFCRCNDDPDGVAAVIFSSGSTGNPKGVMLTHANILANGDMVSQVLHFNEEDRILGSLPFFHSFGYTVTMWLPLLKGIFTAYVPDPLDGKKVGATAEKYRTTIMLGTPTFYSIYSRSCTREQFRHLRLAVAGAERLRENVAKEFQDKFGISLLEGYGITEMSPVISCNVPDYSDGKVAQRGTKVGTVGLPLPGIAARIVDINNYDIDLEPDGEGMLLVNGLNRMAGYLGDEALTRETLHNGWYITGDIAKMDEEGFIHICGRLSRFSKIGGEMVPHVHVEDIIHKVLGFEDTLAVVMSARDDSKGEKLVVLHLPSAASYMDPKAVAEKLKQAGLPNLWIPKEFYEIPEFPVLGSGKLDLKALEGMARSASIIGRTGKIS